MATSAMVKFHDCCIYKQQPIILDLRWDRVIQAYGLTCYSQLARTYLTGIAKECSAICRGSAHLLHARYDTIPVVWRKTRLLIWREDFAAPVKNRCISMVVMNLSRYQMASLLPRSWVICWKRRLYNTAYKVFYIHLVVLFVSTYLGRFP